MIITGNLKQKVEEDLRKSLLHNTSILENDKTKTVKILKCEIKRLARSTETANELYKKKKPYIISRKSVVLILCMKQFHVCMRKLYLQARLKSSNLNHYWFSN